MPIQSTLILGLGSAGTKILQKVKRLIDDFSNGRPVPLIELYGIDTKEQDSAGPAETQLGESEFIRIGNFRPEYYFDENLHPEIASWLSPHLSFYKCADGAGRIRMSGRLAFHARFDDILGHLQGKIENLISETARNQTLLVDPQARTGESIPIIIVSSLCGGTGSSLLIDLALLCSNIVSDCGKTPIIEGIFLLPESANQVPLDREMANTWATLTELSLALHGSIGHFNPFDEHTAPKAKASGPAPNQAKLKANGGAFGFKYPRNRYFGALAGRTIYDRCFLVERMRNRHGAYQNFNDVAIMAAQCISSCVTTDIGDIMRANWADVATNRTDQMDATNHPVNLNYFSGLGASSIQKHKNVIQEFFAASAALTAIKSLVSPNPHPSDNQLVDRIKNLPLLRFEEFLRNFWETRPAKVHLQQIWGHTTPEGIITSLRNQAETKGDLEHVHHGLDRHLSRERGKTEFQVLSLIKEALMDPQMNLGALSQSLDQISEWLERYCKSAPRKAPASLSVEKAEHGLRTIKTVTKGFWFWKKARYPVPSLAVQGKRLEDAYNEKITASFLAQGEPRLQAAALVLKEFLDQLSKHVKQWRVWLDAMIEEINADFQKSVESLKTDRLDVLMSNDKFRNDFLYQGTFQGSFLKPENVRANLVKELNLVDLLDKGQEPPPTDQWIGLFSFLFHKEGAATILPEISNHFRTKAQVIAKEMFDCCTPFLRYTAQVSHKVKPLEVVVISDGLTYFKDEVAKSARSGKCRVSFNDWDRDHCLVLRQVHNLPLASLQRIDEYQNKYNEFLSNASGGNKDPLHIIDGWDQLINFNWSQPTPPSHQPPPRGAKAGGPKTVTAGPKGALSQFVNIRKIFEAHQQEFSADGEGDHIPEFISRANILIQSRPEAEREKLQNELEEILAEIGRTGA